MPWDTCMQCVGVPAAVFWKSSRKYWIAAVLHIIQQPNIHIQKHLAHPWLKNCCGDLLKFTKAYLIPLHSNHSSSEIPAGQKPGGATWTLAPPSAPSGGNLRTRSDSAEDNAAQNWFAWQPPHCRSANTVVQHLSLIMSKAKSPCLSWEGDTKHDAV